jgi:hypothetical protein
MKPGNLLSFRPGAMLRHMIWIFLLSLILAGCATYSGSLRTQQAKAIDPSDTYTVIRVGGNSFEDYMTFALIVPESGKYRFEIFKPDFDYRSSKGLTAKRALDMAIAFVSAQPSFAYSQTNSIIGPDGSVIGYEVRPLYQQILFGQQDILITGYFPKDNNVIEVRVDVDDAVKRRDRGDDRRQRGRR